MPEYKDVTKLKKQISDFKRMVQSPNSDYLTGYVCALSATEGMIAGIPTADVVEVRHGEWSNTDWSGIAINGYMVCTQCNVMIPKCEYNRYCLSYLSFCPKCGAKMDGKEVANNG